MTKHLVVAGASGLIGTELVNAARQRDYRVTTLVRTPSDDPDAVLWDPAAGELDPTHLEGAHSVIVLNGASVGRMPWTQSYRRELVSSRLHATSTVVTALAKLGPQAPALVSGSAVGYYGSAPGRLLTETAGAGSTFLAKLCVQWEAAARRAETTSRVALVRTAPVIHRQGVLKPMITLTSLGLGGPLAGGEQIWPWVSLTDEVRAILHVVDEQLSGPVNVCGPTPASANTIGRALAQELHRPFWLPAPAWAMRLALGSAAVDSLLTTDADARPAVLQDSGFTFTHATAEDAVQAALADS